MSQNLHPRTRSGFSLVLVLCIIIIMLGTLFVATARGTASANGVGQFKEGSRALGAVTVALSRREHDVQLLASVGNAANFADWSQYFGHENYGVDYIGNCEVRWKIEPARTAPVIDAAGNTQIPFVVNPSPDANYVPSSTSNEQPNQTLYMFKISAEARELLGSDVSSRAQGSRFVAISREPLFRYVIFYAQRGAKGDLELGHADGVTIQGNIHSNGAVYIGGGLKINDKIAQRGSIDGSFNSTTTNIGPDVSGLPVTATGVDGFFRLSKPLMYSIVNGFPLTSTSLAAAGTPVGDWTAQGSYNVSNVLFPGETVVPVGANPLAKTGNGKQINPYRILSASGAVTQGPTSADSARMINNVQLKGIGTGANDARDHDRSGSRLWTAVAGSEFSNHARTLANGGIQVALSGTMVSRPFEAQALTYVDADSDATTDDHAYARPTFIDAASGNSTFNLPASGPAIEAPGAYLNLALGGTGNVFLVRRVGGTGWDARLRTDLTSPAPQPTQAGLIIRERFIPETAYWPGTTAALIVDPASPRYLPYAYGKHWYPTINPFTTTDVSDNVFRDRQWSQVSTTPSLTSNISLTALNRQTSYSAGGRLTITAAANPGGSDTSSGLWNSNGYAGTASNGIQRKLYFYRDPWRFVHLRKLSPNTSGNGLKLTYYQDDAHWDEYRSTSTASALPFSGVPIPITNPANGVVASVAGRLGWATAPATPSATFWSARWSGFLKPSASGTYGFGVTTTSTNHCMRVWIDGQLVVEAVKNGGTVQGQALGLSGGRYYPIIVEFASTASGAPGLAPILTWQLIGSALSAIPDSALYPPLADGAFPKANFNGVFCRIDNPQALSGPAAQKVGLMIRPDTIASPALQGGGAYAMVGWSPLRGLFSQRRISGAIQEQRTSGTFFIGAGSGPSGAADGNGNVVDNPTASSVGWNRTAALKEVWHSSSATVTATTPPPRSSTATAVSWSQQPALYSGLMWKDVGGGKTWTLLDNFKVGKYVGTQTWTPYIYQQLNSSITQSVQLINSTPTFITADDSCTLTIFNTATATGSLFSGTMGWKASNRTWWFSDAAGVAKVSGSFNPTTSVPNYLSRTYTNQSNGPNVQGTPVSQVNYAIGSEGSTWPVSGSVIRINKNGVISNATSGDISTVTGLTVVDIRSGTPSIPTPTLTYPADGLATGAATPAAPTLADLTNGGAGRSFSVTRNNTTYTFDLRSWVTGSATFPAAPQEQFLPRNAGWLSPTWAGAAWPTGWGLRPDVWLTSTTAPVLGSSTATLLLGATAVSAPGVVSGASTGYRMTDDVRPVGWNTATEVWLGLVRSGNNLSAKYYIGTTPPVGTTDPGWQTLGNSLDITGWGPGLLAGPCVQSGDVNTATTVTFTDLRVETSLAAPDDVINSADWDATSGATDDLTRYLISQYQVFFGTREITEDFFTWRNPGNSARLADEQWFYDPREFWSQGRWWDHTTALGVRIEKDPFTAPATTFSSTANRELLAKTTVLTLDLQAIQAYLTTRQFGDAVADRITGIGSTATVTNSSSTLASMFNGLIYAVRTNRYPWNPNSNPLLPNTGTGRNPWSPQMASGWVQLPNSLATPGATAPLIANGTALSGLTDPDLLVGGIHKLQPYALAEAPAFMPTRFHHGIRIINGANINWNYPTPSSSSVNSQGGKNWTYAAAPQFGSCRLSIVTPNQLFIQGALNVDQHAVTYRSPTAVLKPTPLAIMGDQITLLSNGWSDVPYQQRGLTVTNVSGPTAVTGAGTVACATLGTQAVSTTYQAGIVTNNIPTSRERVCEGQAAPFIDTVNFLENWNNCRMNYVGSLVVLDSRRYTQSFLLDSYKTYGTTPFGIAGNGAGDPWLSFFGAVTPDWLGQTPPVYSEPTRTYSFNYDFLTSEGTPPFVPFGVSSTGAGGWARIVQ